MSDFRIRGLITSTMRYLASDHSLCYVSPRESRARRHLWLLGAAAAVVPEAL